MSHPRRATPELFALDAGSEVTLAGRLAARDDQGALLVDEHGACRIVGEGLPDVHALVMIQGEWTGSDVRITRVLHAQPGVARPADESEVWALSSHGRARQKRLMA